MWSIMDSLSEWINPLKSWNGCTSCRTSYGSSKILEGMNFSAVLHICETFIWQATKMHKKLQRISKSLTSNQRLCSSDCLFANPPHVNFIKYCPLSMFLQHWQFFSFICSYFVMKIVLRKIPNFFLVYVTFKRLVQILHRWGTEMQKQSKKMEVAGSREKEVRHQGRLRNEHARLLVCKQQLTLVSSN